MGSTKILTRKQTKTLSSQCTHRSSASRSHFVFSFLDFRNALFNIASCANDTEDEIGDESEFPYYVDINYTQYNGNWNENENTTPKPQEQPDSQEPLSPSSKKLPTVTVMIYDEFGRLQDSPRGPKDHSINSLPVTSSSASASASASASSSEQCGQEGKENHSNDDQDSSSTTSSCRLVERLRREKLRRKTVALMSMNDFSGISPTSATKQHKDRIHRKNYNSTKGKKWKKQSWFWRNTNSKEDEEKSDGSVSTQGTRSTSGSGSVTKVPSQDSISTMSSSSSSTRDKNEKTNKTKQSGPVSILRTSSKYTRNNVKALFSESSSEHSASTIRFEEGTVFQDPNQKKRKKVRRLPKSERKGHRHRWKTNKKSQAQSDPTGIEIVGLSRREATLRLGSDRCYKDDDNYKLTEDLTPYVFR